MARTINVRNLFYLVIACLGLSCEDCVELNSNEYGFEGNAVFLSYRAPNPGNTYYSFRLQENKFRGSLPDSTFRNTLTMYPFVPTNTFIVMGLSDTDTVVLSSISYSLYKAGKCGLGIDVGKPVLEHSFDSTRVSYNAYNNSFEIIIFKP